MKRALSMVGLLFLVAAILAGCAQATPTAPPEPEAEPIRIAAVLPGRVDDMSFNQEMYEGVMRVQEHLGDRVEVTYIEGLYEVVDIEPAVRDYAAQGYDLILGHGFQFQDPIMNVAPEYPDLHFAIGPGAYMTADNVSLYDSDNAQLGYLLGTVAGLMSESGVLGSIGGVDVPNIHMMHESFRLAIEAVNPDAQVLNLYTGDFRDAEKAREAALSMIDQGADVIYISGDGMIAGGVEATRDRGVYSVSGSNMSALAPEVFLASIVPSYDVAIEQMVADIEAGTFGDQTYRLTLQNGALSIVIHLEEDTAEIRDQVDSIVQGLTDGSIEIPEIVIE